MIKQRRTRAVLTTIAVFTAVLGLGAGSAYASSGNLVTNGGFDLGTYQPNDGGNAPTGWHADLNYGAVELANSATGNPDTGADWIDLDASPSAGAIYQDIPTIPGHSYLVTLKHAANPNCEPGVKEMAVKWAGQTIDTVQFDNTTTSPSNMGWLPLSYSVSGSSGTTTRLEFASLTAGSCGPAVDSVSVIDQTPPDPEPSCAGGGTCDWNLASDFEFNLTSPTPTNPFPDSDGYHNTWALRQGGDMGGALATTYGEDGVFHHWEGAQADCCSNYPIFGVNTGATPFIGSTYTIYPHKVAVHPFSTTPAVVTWTSPINGTVNVTGGIVDDDGNGGDGVGWTIALNNLTLYDGSIANAGQQAFSAGHNDAHRQLNSLQVSQGDTLQFIINADPGNNPSGGDMGYDTTELDADIRQVGGTYGVRPVVSTGGVANVSSHSATVTGTVNPEGQATTWRFEWAPSPSGPWTPSGTGSLNDSGDRNATSPQPVSGPIPQSPATFSADSTYYYRLVAINGAGGPVDGTAARVHTNPIPDVTPPGFVASGTNLPGSSSILTANRGALGQIAYGTVATVAYSCVDAQGTNGARSSGLALCRLTDNGQELPAGAGASLRGTVTNVSRSAALPTTSPGSHTLELLATDMAGNRTDVTWTYTVAPKPTPVQQQRADQTVQLQIIKQWTPSFWDQLTRKKTIYCQDARSACPSAGNSEMLEVWDNGQLTTPQGGAIIGAGGGNIIGAGGGNFSLYNKTTSSAPLLVNVSHLYEITNANGVVVGIIGAGGGNIIGAGGGNIIGAGGGNILSTAAVGIIGAGGGNIIGAGGGNIIGAGGGNLINDGAQWIIGAGGGNIIGAGGGNIIGAGGGNIIGAGGGNFGLSLSNPSSFKAAAGLLAPPNLNLIIGAKGPGGVNLITNVGLINTNKGAFAGDEASSGRAVNFASGHVRFLKTGQPTMLALKPTAAGAKLIKKITALNRKLRRHHKKLLKIKLTIRNTYVPPGGGRSFTITSVITSTPV